MLQEYAEIYETPIKQIPSRARRMMDWDRMKKRAVRQWKLWNVTNPTPAQIAGLAETHCVPCSCWLCAYDKITARRVPRDRRIKIDY